MYENVINGIWWIPGRDKFLPDSHMYVIGTPEASDYSIVDCGLMEMGSYKLEELGKIGIKPNDIKRIIMTHTHIDHIGCLPELLKEMPHVEICVHSAEAEQLETGDASIIFGSSMFESMIRENFSLPEGYFKTTVHRKLNNGDLLTLGGIQFKVVHIPGHSAGSIGLWNEENRLFMSGDTIYADGAIGRYDLESANPSELKNSLKIIGALGVDILLPCHNRIVKRGAEAMVANTVEQWVQFIND